MTILTTEYGPLVRELVTRAAERRQPAVGTFELTNRCNLSCRMCYIRHSAGHGEQKKKELPPSAWLSLARQAAESGMVFLLLTGGEVFLRSDFFEIYEPLTRMGLILTLFTNGTLVTSGVARRLACAPPSRTEITLYGATVDTYESITGVSGSYTACCRGIEALVAHNIPLGLKTTITRQNVDELEAMRQMAHGWGVPFSASWLLNRRRDGSPSDVDSCRLSASDCVEIEATDNLCASEWTEVPVGEPSTPRVDNFYCQAGKSSFVVNAQGEMNVCLDLNLPAAKPLETGFTVAWSQVQRFVDSAPSTAPECLGCAAREYCPRCPAWSLMETNTLTDPVPYLCQIARARKDRYARQG
jgi:radical SAM protein with 4Fe4S-binding SPASM domain